ncbi:MAG TPA: hypothetical protein VFZ89_18425 [Solirubrobacteraceae bacterium]
MRPQLRWVLPASLALALAVPAHADSGRYVAHTLTEPASPGLEVTGVLSDLRAIARARIVLPAEWRRLRADRGKLAFLTTGTSCRYRVTITLHSVLAAPQTAEARVAAGLPAATSRHLIDRGHRGAAAFRVVRAAGIGGRVRVRGLRVAELTRRADVVPAGQAAWTDLRASAISRAGDECHSGTWRERLGPQLGDALATARTHLTFVKER